MCERENCLCKDPENPEYHEPNTILIYEEDGRSISRFVRAESRAEVRVQINNYKIFKALMGEWLDLAPMLAKLKSLGLDNIKVRCPKS